MCFPQTQEVQKAMDEKRFEEAVKLRGRYGRGVCCALTEPVENHANDIQSAGVSKTT